MESYVGIDAHCNAGLELAAIEARSGELLWRDRCRLDGDLLREAIGRAPRPCTVVFEQGELATWLHLALSGCCKNLIAADPRRNRLISTSPDKDDPFDALALAQLARGRYVREVYQPPVAFLNLRLQVRHHDRLNRHISALKNQVKALFRYHGIPVVGADVYSPEHRPAFLKCLPEAARPPGEDLLGILDVAAEKKDAALQLLVQHGRRFPPVRRLMTVPEIGNVRAATFAAYLVTPTRFPSRSHIRSYCGFFRPHPTTKRLTHRAGTPAARLQPAPETGHQERRRANGLAAGRSFRRGVSRSTRARDVTDPGQAGDCAKAHRRAVCPLEQQGGLRSRTCESCLIARRRHARFAPCHMRRSHRLRRDLRRGKPQQNP